MRLENWPVLLSGFIERSLQAPFIWGERDCCLFAANAVREITGVDYAQELRGRYKTARKAQELLKASGGVTGIMERTALEEVTPLLAQRGDVVLIETDQGSALGIVGMDGNLLAQGPGGLTTLPLQRAVRAWRV